MSLSSEVVNDSIQEVDRLCLVFPMVMAVDELQYLLDSGVEYQPRGGRPDSRKWR